MKSVRLKHIDCFLIFIKLNDQGLNLNFIELALLLIDVDTESNPGSRQNDCKSSPRQPKKIKVTSYSKVQNVFFNTMQPLSLCSLLLYALFIWIFDDFIKGSSFCTINILDICGKSENESTRNSDSFVISKKKKVHRIFAKTWIHRFFLWKVMSKVWRL